MDCRHASAPVRATTRNAARLRFDYDRVPAMHRERTARYAECLTDFRLTASLNLDAVERALRLCSLALILPEPGE